MPPVEYVVNANAPQSHDREIDLSIIVPVFNEQGNIPVLHQELDDVLKDIEGRCEILFVDDGSTDGSSEELDELAAKDKRVKIIRFKRNYGQTSALSAGFKMCQGERIVTLDGDLQNDPADIPKLLAMMDEGYDLVNGWRKERQDHFWTRRLPSVAANKFINKLIEGTTIQLNDYGCTLKAYHRDIVKGLNIYGEMHRFIPVFAAWLGGRITEIPVNHRPRVRGQAKYNLSRIPTVMLDLLVVRFFSDYMTRPIQFFGKIAMGVFLLGLFFTFLLLISLALLDQNINWAAITILLITVFILCFQIVTMGLIGEMQIRSYFEGQKKDQYIIKEIIHGGS